MVLLPAFAQGDSPAAPPPAPPVASQSNGTAPPASPAAAPAVPPAASTADRTVNPNPLGVKPGTQAIKPKDYQDASGYFHPFTRMAGFVLQDQKAIWTSPFHTSKKDAKYWVIFGGATGALIATDKYVSKNAPNTSGLRTLGNSVSYLGEAYTLLPISAAFYFAGTKVHSDHFRETGLLSFEALANVTIVDLALKSIFDRQRPLEGQGNGEFWAGKTRWNSSFPSGHAIETFALASVLAHEFKHKKWVQILAYSYAAGVVGARLAANQHFPGDVMAGGAIGWFVGDYVYARRHNSDLDKKTAAEKLLSHIRIGGDYEPSLPGR
jgi:membrane-associated phospholipid phosphatase